ncbi:hypothetical protein [Trichoplusia ni ascovirus 6b]|nr:hypothetical protein [Trichoplusia ni ascovirus 6b]
MSRIIIPLSKNFFDHDDNYNVFIQKCIPLEIRRYIVDNFLSDVYDIINYTSYTGCDIYVSQLIKALRKTLYISKKQLRNLLRIFKIFDTSTTFSVNILLNKTLPSRMVCDDVINIEDDMWTSFKCIIINNDKDDDDEDREHNHTLYFKFLNDDNNLKIPLTPSMIKQAALIWYDNYDISLGNKYRIKLLIHNRPMINDCNGSMVPMIIDNKTLVMYNLQYGGIVMSFKDIIDDNIDIYSWNSWRNPTNGRICCSFAYKSSKATASSSSLVIWYRKDGGKLEIESPVYNEVVGITMLTNSLQILRRDQTIMHIDDYGNKQLYRDIKNIPAYQEDNSNNLMVELPVSYEKTFSILMSILSNKKEGQSNYAIKHGINNILLLNKDTMVGDMYTMNGYLTEYEDNDEYDSIFYGFDLKIVTRIIDTTYLYFMRHQDLI